MTEDYLHYLWRFKSFNTSNLTTVKREGLEILDWGFHNKDSGPDFFNAKIKLGNKTWVGNIEIHIKSSDWNTHKHQHDNAYNNVILHVVFDYDKEIKNKQEVIIPTLVLRDRINYSNYESFKSFVEKPIPCLALLNDVSQIVKVNFKEKMLFSRLEKKASVIELKLKETNFDWEEIFYQSIARSFGMKVNAEPFETLAKITPIKILHKLSDQIQVESILFGQSGILNKDDNINSYKESLIKEYKYQKVKHQFIPLSSTIFKFSKLRPPNFPTIRIAQLANLLFKERNLFDKIIKSKSSLNNIKDIFCIEINNGFWYSHYTFKKGGDKKIKRVGDSLIHSIIINTVVPFLFVYGKTKGDDSYVDYSLSLLEQVKPESNSIIKKFENQIENINAADSQSLIEAYNTYCSSKKCLTCIVGIDIFNRK